MQRDLAAVAANVVRELKQRGQTLSTAESLTGGLVGEALTSVPGASAVYRGGVIAYATDLKASVLGVDKGLLAQVGAVDADVARQMALGVAHVCGSDIGLATTGVAGPDGQDGHSPGTVFICAANARADRESGQHLELAGGREQIREQTCIAALNLVLALLRA